MTHLTWLLGASVIAPLGGMNAGPPDGRRRKMRLLCERGPVISIVAPAFLLIGCANTTPVPTTVITAGMPNPEEALRQSMQHVDAEMAELGGMRPDLAQSAAIRTAAPVVPEDLERVVSFIWSGSLDTGVAKLAQSIGYTFYTTAQPDTPPLDVTVQLESAPAIQVFKALGEAAGARATVEVDPLHHQVQVIHHV